MLTTAPRGTKDILPGNSDKWQWLEDKINHICRVYNYQEIRTPIFEHTELFCRGIGDNTDVVDKEMYTFNDRGGRSITLRPENTAAVVRAFIEHKLYSDYLPAKLFYCGPMFRYDRPQAGRYRQFHQFGVETIGVAEPIIDAEVLIMARDFLRVLGLQDIVLMLNTIGCSECRPVYRAKLTGYIEKHLTNLCFDCNNRYKNNPLRVLDCKNADCQTAMKDAPSITDEVCPSCQDHFQTVLRLLNENNIDYGLDKNLVRGLDYYNRTTFEFKFLPLGAQSTVLGGGRYDGLIGDLGGESMPAVGFAAGMERLLLALEMQNTVDFPSHSINTLVMPLGAAGKELGMKLLTALRQAEITADMVYVDRSMKAQLRHANKLRASYAVIIGDNEVEANKVNIKNLASGEQLSFNWQEGIAYIIENQVKKGE